MEGRIIKNYSEQGFDFKLILIQTSIEVTHKFETKKTFSINLDEDSKYYFNEYYVNNNNLCNSTPILSDYEITLSILTFIYCFNISPSIMIAGYIYFERFIEKVNRKINKHVFKK